MARTIDVTYGGNPSSFGIVRVQRDKLYGRRRREVVDEDGESCVAATLTRDGTALLPPGTIAMVYADSDFRLCSRKDLQAVDADGTPVETLPSTLGVEQPLEGPVDPQEVLEHVTQAVYELDVSGADEGLKAQLDAGEIFKTEFNYRAGHSASTAFILGNAEGYFALAGRPAEFGFLRKDEPPVDLSDDEDDDPFGDDDLDFSMF